MFHKILVANRGEIAVRIIRTCMYMGIETVAVYSTVDKDSLHVQLADEAVCIGGAKSQDSYLNMENIISAAINTGAEAIHPGFGFLSENAEFAALCEDCGITFIGPKSEHIKAMGNKSWARHKMIEIDVPVVPGSEGEIENIEEALKLARSIGYPVLVKASAGGGGRGMRIANDEESLKNAFNTAKAEAISAFGDGTLYLEKYVANPRHIEFQVLCDKYNNIIHLYQRDCSIQRRNQKVVEEAPGLIDSELRDKMIEATIKACRAINYENAGTIEFLVSGNDFYFIEMNTRIQVEHPITEMITGKDIVKEQIKIAAGEKIAFSQDEVSINGYSIECRINAESPKHGFRPSPGKVKLLHIPSGNGVRFDSLLFSDYTVQPFYDSMVGKLIVHGENREEAVKKMRAALEELVIQGIETNQNFLYMIMNNPDYIKGNFDTSFINLKLERLLEYDDNE
ncbi:MAG: acetyl-CoA carboxylase biotin carboxylase subunit [Candidatus Izemoplasmatales bacterium]|jgi:acetyl-CoA carboxylase biotin carboxylase subunit|nr:acetyl-CoA carboxylase biotin carboxylase subunit [Candidatus Izemoplasmatales bacterium]